MQESLFFLAEQVVFCLFICCGLSLLIQTKLWVQLVRWFYSQEKQSYCFMSLAIGMACLPVGLFLVLVHNDWSVSLSVITTLVGWACVAKSLLLILFPQLAFKMRVIYLRSEGFLKWKLRVCGVLYIVLGLLTLYNFWNI